LLVVGGVGSGAPNRGEGMIGLGGGALLLVVGGTPS
jgi:hypothetical protein